MPVKLNAMVMAHNLSKGATVLRRESNGSVTVLSLANPWVGNLARQPNGSITVSE